MSSESTFVTSEICVPPAPPPLPSVSLNLNENIIPKHSAEDEEVVVCRLKESVMRILDIQDFENIQLTYTHLDGIIQEGPTCGLVALSIASSLFPARVEVPAILDLAKSLGYSKQGEMFSAVNMSILANNLLSTRFKVTLFSGGMKARMGEILEDLHKGYLYLIPYDADKNHSPATLKGHKAHWAVLCGAVGTPSCCFVLARQGKSKQVAIWSFDSLNESNSNLTEVSEDRKEEDYVLENVSETLAGKFVLLQPIR